MEKEKAVAALRELIRCEIESTKQNNFRKNGITNKLQRDERKAVQVLFTALVGYSAGAQEIDEILE